MMSSPRLKKRYFEDLLPQLKKELGCKSLMQVPRLRKIIINQGLGAAVSNQKLIPVAVEELTAITGQKAVPTKAKNAISNFKLRENMLIGVRVTLRGDKMYEFLDRFINIALPRVRDFQGLGGRLFDGRGNVTIGIKEQIIFPEISIDKVDRITGMNVTLVTDGDSDRDSYELLKALGMPFKKDIKIK